MSKLIVVYGCSCHTGNLYMLDNHGMVSKVVYERGVKWPVSISHRLDLSYKEVTSIQTLVNILLSNLT